jgi:LacI family transcriptional regulator
VALIVMTSMTYGREILHGISQYIREYGPWSVYLEQRSLQDPEPPWLRGWRGDGIILGEVSPASSLARRLRIPTVDLDEQVDSADPRAGRGRPHIQSDHRALGTLAAEHLLERGFNHFAYFGYPVFGWSRRSSEGFAARVQAAGFSCHQYRDAQPVSFGHQLPSWEDEVDGASRWIAGLPKPLGLMACNDFRGLQALDACRRAAVAVPEEVAVIGVDNEVLACEMANPPLSSVIPDCRRIGYEAAALLDRLMQGESPPRTTREIPPIGIVTRQSTEITAIADRTVAEAVTFIREHASEGISVDDVVGHVTVSRSVLQKRFREALGRTVHESIAAVRLRRVQQLLIETDLPYEVVADRAGFSNRSYLSVVFRNATGTTLGAYRREHAVRRS